MKNKINRIIFMIIVSFLFVIFSVVNIIKVSSIEIPVTQIKNNNNTINSIPEKKEISHTIRTNKESLTCGVDNVILTKDISNTINNSIYIINEITKDNIDKDNFNTISEPESDTIIYEEIEVKEPVVYYSNRYNISLSENDMQMFCTVVSSETGYCEDKVQKAVAHTIINRIISDQFPDNMYDVVTQRNQYTAIHSYFDGQYRKDLYPGSELWNHTMNLLFEVIEEEDFIKGAVAYYNPYQKGYNDWFEQFTLTYEDEFGRFFVV